MRKKETQHAERTTSPSVHVHIDELVLHGFAPVDRYRIADAFQAELTRLFAEHGLSAALGQGAEASRLKAEEIHVTPLVPASAIGTQVARSVYGSLNPKDHDSTRSR
jgi:hypothetical protein